MSDGLLKIGLLVGREWSFPPAFLDEVNLRTADTGVMAEYVKVGGTQMNEPSQYRVIVDRISHEVPYYRSMLKNAVLQGTLVIHDPFMWTADDKFFGASMLAKMGIPHPKTVVLPNKEYVPGIVHEESLRNLIYPIDWEGIVEYLGGFPLVLKDAHGGGWKSVHIVHDLNDLFEKYNDSGLLTMILQEYIHWDNYGRCMGLGQQYVHVMKYTPRPVYGNNYLPEHDFPAELVEQLVDHTLRLNRAFGYDMNAVEFAIKDGVPYAIDFMNPAPDMDVNSLGRVHFDWMVKTLADVAIGYATDPNAQTRSRYRWGQLAQSLDGGG
ncbi:MAG: hypothetical protein IPK19_33575 [Chloroflexi bacterium]|nr:hypothetical protein [Chloroflexota bacterium]